MKRALLASLFFSGSLLFADGAHEAPDFNEEMMESPCKCSESTIKNCDCEDKKLLNPYYDLRISVNGQGVAPVNTASPAQAYALAKRAAIADAYRLIAEKVKGVRVEGKDTIKNMMIKRSTVRTYVDAMIRNANIVETTFEEGLCEVEMEIVLSYSQFAH